jgi:hypothetical protein
MCRGIAAAYTKKRMLEMLREATRGMSANELQNYWQKTANDFELATASKAGDEGVWVILNPYDDTLRKAVRLWPKKP